MARGLEMRWECGGNAWFHVQGSRNRRNRSENETVPVPLWHGESVVGGCRAEGLKVIDVITKKSGKCDE